jgi:hypothetical protein
VTKMSGRIYTIIETRKASLKDMLKAVFRRGWVKQTGELSEETKATLTILIAEIYDLNPNEEIKRLLETWVKAHDLHPEKVQRLTAEELAELLARDER